MASYSAARLVMFSLFAIILSFSFISFEASAATESFSFIEFNIAFVLGLSLPVLLMVFIIKPRPVIKKRLPVLLTITLLGLLYSLNFHPQNHLYLSLIFSGLIFQIISYWSSNYLLVGKALDFSLALKNALFFGLFCLYLFLLYSTAVSASVAWLILTSVQIIFTLSYIWLSRNISHEVNIRSIILLAINIAFAAGVYFWLEGRLALNLLVAVSVITYLLAMANGCWHIVTTLIARENDHKALSTRPQVQVSYDPTTNLPNYQYALSFFEHSIATNESARYAVIIFKPTNFRQINGVLGHHNSDILLLQLAYCLQKSIESKHELLNFSTPEAPVRLARLQGLNFLLVMDVSQTKHSEEIIIEQLCKELALAVPGPMSFKSFSSFFKLAFGVAFVGQESHNVTEVIAWAEDALLHAEKQQKLVGFFNQELAIFNQQQLHKMEQLKHAIQDNTIHWSLQPQVKVENKRLIGFELQVSWQRQDDETLKLTDMMVIAEQSGDAYTLSRQIVSQAFKALVKLQHLNMLIPVAIKLPENSLLEPDLIDYIEQQSVKHNVDCQWLMVEVQEAILLMSSPQAKASIDQLKSLGVKISIDQFSGSYEALRYIRRMAVSGIKIDCYSLAKATAGSSDKAIINALITLTRKMDLPLIGTNINVIAIEEMFIAMGGEFGQGQRYSAGITQEELPYWLTAWQKQYPEKT
ncbi:GGDEF domain-containing phosphodiesterase [Cognaticolwellia beringensis]|uniref:Phosphodiesterase n=1 Tax=Cognaticolwellia beringensis TaxID=1967665 RepID=A0A222G925_9GAMM|nr:GGDEF domain-containing phosphodiesterase [Cognaticolwellia beringensis]ASP48113.1 phosphodiesterase [Cognaticolwellia beringensis]